MTPVLDPQLLAQLRSVDTPTVCNAIEVAEGRRGFADFTRQTVHCSDPDGGAIVGYARTARIAARQPSSESPDRVRQRRMDYYRYMSEGPRPGLVVVEDTDFPACIGAFWGEINGSVHKGFGLSGVLTNGVMRDLGDLPPDFMVIAGSIGPSHGFVHVTDIACDVSVLGLKVQPDALIHADRHGAVIIPEAVIPVLAEAITTLIRNERIILDAAEAPDFDFDRFAEAWTEFERVRT